MGAIDPGALTLNASPLDSPLYVLNGVGDPDVIAGNGIFVELQAYDLVGAAATTFRFATDGYNDPSAPGYFEPRMVQSLNFRREMFSGNATGGPNRVSYGEMRLANDDAALDSLRTNYAVAGWPATIWIGDPSNVYGTWEKLITGKPEQVLFSFRDLAIVLRDRLQDFQQPVQTNKYLGDNILPDGLEGNIDLKDKPKPLVFGRVQNITPILVNTSKLIYQVNDGPFGNLTMVYDQGVELTYDNPYGDVNDMLNNEPLPGYFRFWLAGGYFRLGATPVGTITCDAQDAVNVDGAGRDVANTAAQVAARIAVRPIDSGEGGIVSADVEWNDVTLLDLANSATVGIWLADETTFASALDAVLGSIGAWYGFDRLGKFRMARHEAPISSTGGVCTFRMFGPYVAGIGDFDIVDVRFLPTSDPDRGVPTWQVNLDYGVNYTVQQKDNLGGAVSNERAEFLAKEVRTATASQSSLKTPFPLAMVKNLSTLLLNQADAEVEAQRLLQLYQAGRDFIEIDTRLTSDLVATVDIGKEVFVVLPRFFYGSGKSMKIIGMQYNPSSRGLTLMLWG